MLNKSSKISMLNESKQVNIMEKTVRQLDLLIIGGGPAGLSAAIYAARARIDVVLLETKLPGGQLLDSYTIENYPGFETISGSALAEIMTNQAVKLGAVIERFSKITAIHLTDEEKTVETKKVIYKARTVIISTGALPRKLPIDNETKFSGKGIHYCAVCDGIMYEGGVVGVVGGGSAALEEALFLAKFASKVIMIRRYDYFKGEKIILDQVLTHPKIEVLYNSNLIDVEGDEFVSRALIENTKTGERNTIELNAVFGYIGTQPKTDLFKDFLQLTPDGYIRTDGLMQTNIQGVYAAGDVREQPYRQITTAVADGTIAALTAEKYLQFHL